MCSSGSQYSKLKSEPKEKRRVFQVIIVSSPFSKFIYLFFISWSIRGLRLKLFILSSFVASGIESLNRVRFLASLS